MTPAQRARQIEDQERRAESEAAIQRALAYAATKRAEDRAKLDAFFGREEAPATTFFRHGRTPKLYEAFGVSMSLRTWTLYSAVSQDALRFRLRHGWPFELAIVTPPHTSLERARIDYAGVRPTHLGKQKP